MHIPHRIIIYISISSVKHILHIARQSHISALSLYHTIYLSHSPVFRSVAYPPMLYYSIFLLLESAASLVPINHLVYFASLQSVWLYPLLNSLKGLESSRKTYLVPVQNFSIRNLRLGLRRVLGSFLAYSNDDGAKRSERKYCHTVSGRSAFVYHSREIGVYMLQQQLSFREHVKTRSNTCRNSVTTSHLKAQVYLWYASPR